MRELRRVRNAMVEDLQTLARIMAHSPLLHRYGVTESGALNELQLARSEGDLLLVVSDAEDRVPHGLAWVIFTRAFDRGAYLRLLLVDGSAQRANAGSELLREAEVQASRRARHLYFLVTSDNFAAQRFYERHGFRRVGELPGLVRSDLDEVLYHKPLATSQDSEDRQ